MYRSFSLYLYLNVVHASSSFIRRKSKQAMRDYKKVQIQLENLETSVRDRCKKEFTGTTRLAAVSFKTIRLLRMRRN